MATQRAKETKLSSGAGWEGEGNTLKKVKVAEYQCELMMRLEREEEANF